MSVHFHEEDLPGDVTFAEGPIAIDTEETSRACAAESLHARAPGTGVSGSSCGRTANRWAGGAAVADGELLAIDCLDGAAPAGEGFFEIEFDGVFDVVALTGEEGMWFL